jgi:stearoyl-CoA desaturase (delta-9 desaturase)
MVSLTATKVVSSSAKGQAVPSTVKETVAVLRPKGMEGVDGQATRPSDFVAVGNGSDGRLGFKRAHANLPVTPELNMLFGKVPGLTLNPMMVIELPLVLTLLIIYRAHFRWNLMPMMLAVYLWKECVPMSVCLHRYFSHKGFRCSRPMQACLYVLGCMASQGPPLWWASKHRRHHSHCDKKEDPHSPVAYSALYGWMGWVWLPGAEGPLGSGVDEEWIQDLMKFPELVVGENIYWAFPLLSHLAFYAYGGLGHALYVSALSGITCQVLTLYFNVAFHREEEHHSHIRSDEVDPATGKGKLVVCKAVDLPFDPLANIFGEAYHSWHHLYPRAYKRPGLDVPYWTFILPLKTVGLIYGDNIMAKSKVQ